MKMLAGWSTVLVLLMGVSACRLNDAKPQPPPDPGAPAEPKAGQVEAEAAPQPLDAKVIAAALGVEAAAGPDGVVKGTWARNDVPVTVDGVRFPPAAGLTSWAAFTPTSGGAMVMGDTVVFQDEVSPAMDAAFAHGLEVSALHNHFFFDEPKVYFMHIGGTGDPATLAAGVKEVWDAIREVRAAASQPASQFPGPTPSAGGALDDSSISQILGHTAETKPGGVVKVTVPRKGTMHGTAIGGSMGLTTWAAFTGSDELAAVDGDFIMTAAEVQPVLRALRKHGIHVVALHNHMVGGEPFFYFTHYWGKGPAAELARGLAAALEAQSQATTGDHAQH